MYVKNIFIQQKVWSFFLIPTLPAAGRFLQWFREGAVALPLSGGEGKGGEEKNLLFTTKYV